jgi:hypothetical protein
VLLDLVHAERLPPPNRRCGRPDTIIIADTFAKKSRTTPQGSISRAAHRLKRYDKLSFLKTLSAREM